MIITKKLDSSITGINNLKQSFHFIEFFPAPAIILDENLQIIRSNEYVNSVLGDKNSLTGKSISEIIGGPKSEEIIVALKKSFINSIPFTKEIKIRTFDNRLLDALSMFNSFSPFETTEKFGVFAILDFTSHKMKEGIIRDSEARFKNMANTAPVMIWISDVEGLFSFVNKVWLEYSGGELGTQLGMNWLNKVHSEDLQKLMNDYKSALRNEKPFSIEFRLKNKNGNFEWMLIKGKPRFNPDNIYMGFIGSCINIQEQKEIEAKISKLNKELVETIATRDKFFSIISHDLRSPMAGLMGLLDILNYSYDSLEEIEKRELIRDATSVTKTTYTLMENLLEWSRIQTGTINYQPEILNVYRLVENISDLYGQNVKNKSILLRNDTKPEQLIYADKSMTETILRNLISNAIKFTHNGGSIIVSSEIDDKMMIIKVKDSGVGIDKENIENLFRVDVNYSTKGTAKESGTGLGLIICKELAEKQKGTIWVESKKNEGSTFYFSIPLTK